MPKVVRFHQLGGPENLRIEDLPLRELRKGEVKLRVQAIGLNRAESMFYHGMYLEDPKLPSTLGYEAAGVVKEVGPGVDTDWIAKTVATIPAFSMIEYGMVGEEVIAPVAALGEYPPNLSPVEGAAIWMQYMTAYGALVEFGHVTAGDFVLITAASSSVGLAAIQ
ncbi:MAG TPA: alcohol dehydrogenase catalytic domain-containing protein, partial [Silvibacterium sp.]|nr:alcohol dehydrogenase catalytic domain-containing protein [Silvibacterium sp.]